MENAGNATKSGPNAAPPKVTGTYIEACPCSFLERFPGCRPSLRCLGQILAVRGILFCTSFPTATQRTCNAWVCACRKRRLLASRIDSAVTDSCAHSLQLPRHWTKNGHENSVCLSHNIGSSGAAAAATWLAAQWPSVTVMVGSAWKHISGASVMVQLRVPALAQRHSPCSPWSSTPVQSAGSTKAVRCRPGSGLVSIVAPSRRRRSGAGFPCSPSSHEPVRANGAQAHRRRGSAGGGLV